MTQATASYIKDPATGAMIPNPELVKAGIIASAAPGTGSDATGRAGSWDTDPNTGLVKFNPAPSNVAPAGQTPASTYQLPYEGDTPEMAAAKATQAKMLADKANQTVDEAAIRAKKLAEMQAEIDAQNTLYAGKLQRAQLAGAGRLGETTAISARRGLLGSDFGAGLTATTDNANQDVYNSIEEEKNAAVQGILSQVRKNTADEFAAKTAAKEAGVNDYLAYLSGQKDAKAKKVGDIAQMVLDSGYGIDQMDSQIENIAKEAGVNKDAIISSYKTLKYNKDQAAAKAKLESDKLIADIGKTVAEGGKAAKETSQIDANYQLEVRKQKAVEDKNRTDRLAAEAALKASTAKDKQAVLEKFTKSEPMQDIQVRSDAYGQVKSTIPVPSSKITADNITQYIDNNNVKALAVSVVRSENPKANRVVQADGSTSFGSSALNDQVDSYYNKWVNNIPGNSSQIIGALKTLEDQYAANYKSAYENSASLAKKETGDPQAVIDYFNAATGGVLPVLPESKDPEKEAVGSMFSYNGHTVYKTDNANVEIIK